MLLIVADQDVSIAVLRGINKVFHKKWPIMQVVVP